MNQTVLTAFIAVSVAASASAQQPRKAMSIDNFDYSAVLTSIQAIWGSDVNLGVGINAMMTKRIQQDGRFVVVERRKVKSLMAEQDFANSSRVKRGTGARTGEIRGTTSR